MARAKVPKADGDRVFATAPSSCGCTYCNSPTIQGFVTAGLKAERDAGAKRPSKIVVQRVVAEKFGCSIHSVYGWLKCCPAWTDPWPGEEDDG